MLDEATSNVDGDTEAKLERVVESMLEGRTRLVIGHRLSTIRCADRIVVLHKGPIVEQGTYEEVLGLRRVYARLYAPQFARDGPRGRGAPFGRARLIELTA